MPRYYAKKDKLSDYDNILKAIKQVKIHKTSIRQAAKAHNIPKSTLAWHIANFDKAKIDSVNANVNVMEEDIDFCIICMKNMLKKENRRNTANCIACDRGVHLSCAGANPNTFTCLNRDSQ